MSELSISKLQVALQEREQLTLRAAALTAVNVVCSGSKTLHKGVSLWLSGKLTKLYAQGDYTLGDVMELTHASQFEALCIMDALEQHPEEAADVVWFSGYDRVETAVEMGAVTTHEG